MGRNKAVTAYWVVVATCCSLVSTIHAADTLDAIGLTQQAVSTALNGQQVDADRSRSRVDGHPGEDSLSANARVDCFDSSSDVTTLLQDDLARVTFDLSIEACSNPAANATTTVGGSAQLGLGIDRTSRKVISLSRTSSQPISGVVSLQRLGDRRPAWQIDLSEQPLSFDLAFAIELAAGDYLLDVSATETTRRDHTTDLRVSLVNRGDVNGNERFDSADLAVLNAILSQDVYVLTADMDDDGDNDAADRGLWTNGLKPRVIPSVPLLADGDVLHDLLQEDEGVDLADVLVDLVDEPAVVVDEPVATPDEPVATPDEPMVTPDEPMVTPDEPMVTPDEPMVTPDEPAVVVLFDPVFPDPVFPNEPVEIASVQIATPTVIGDIDGDGEVDFVDFLAFSRAFGPDGAFNPEADFDNDGSVDFPDFLVFTKEFGSEGQSSLAPEPVVPIWFVVLVFTLSLRASQKRRTSSCSPAESLS